MCKFLNILDKVSGSFELAFNRALDVYEALPGPARVLAAVTAYIVVMAIFGVCLVLPGYLCVSISGYFVFLYLLTCPVACFIAAALKP